MKIVNTAIFIEVLICILISRRTPLHAQSTPTSQPATSRPATPQPTTRSLSANSPVALEGDDKPWNRGIPVATRQAARDSFLEGNRLFNIPLFTRAAEKYIAALDKWKHPAFYFNLALAQLNLSQDVDAHDNLKQALKYGWEPLGADQYKEAQKQLQEVERQLGRIQITCPTPGAEVTLDGAAVFTGPGSYEGWATAKAHEITAKKSDYLPQARRLFISSGELKTLDLRLVTLSEAADTGRRWAVWKPWTVVAAGVAIAASSGLLHAVAARNFSDYDHRFQQQACAMSGGCTMSEIRMDLNAQLSRTMQEQHIAVSGYITSGAVISAGVVLLYLNRPRLPEQNSTSSSPKGIAVIPTMSPDRLGFIVSVSTN